MTPVVERLLEELEKIGQVIDRVKEGLQKLEQTNEKQSEVKTDVRNSLVKTVKR